MSLRTLPHFVRSFGPAISLSLLALAAPSPAATEGISDNSFFLEEAYNQEAGVVQHIQTATWAWDREAGSTTRSFTYAFTQEWPLGGMRHQISYTVPYERQYGDQPRANGIGDIQIHYRFQAFEEGSRRPAFAPRATLILPTGDDREGLGAGVVAYQVNLPVSKKVGDHLHTHFNAGLTMTPGARTRLAGGGRSPARDLAAMNVGASAILALHPVFHAMVEAVVNTEESIDGFGQKATTTRALIAPGARFAINTDRGMQWVLGASVPIGITNSEDDAGALLYLSIEHPFR